MPDLTGGDGGHRSPQVVNLHYMLSKTAVKSRPSVLWCYKKELYMSRCGHVPATVLCLAVTIESRYSESRRYVRKRLHQQCGVATQLQAQWTQHTSSIPQVYHAFVCCPHCSHKKKRMQQIKKLMQRGLLDPEQEGPVLAVS